MNDAVSGSFATTMRVSQYVGPQFICSFSAWAWMRWGAKNLADLSIHFG